MTEEVNLLDLLAPFLNVLGGLAGLTVCYFVWVLWQNKKKLKALRSIEDRLLVIETGLTEIKIELASIKYKK